MKENGKDNGEDKGSYVLFLIFLMLASCFTFCANLVKYVNDLAFYFCIGLAFYFLAESVKQCLK